MGRYRNSRNSSQNVDLKKLFAKSSWRRRNPNSWVFYCPSCKVERRVPYRPQPGGFRHFFQIGLTAAFFTLMTWSWFSWKGIVSFVPFWIIFETIYRSKVRAAILCNQCGFDPVLYLVDVQRARDEIEVHWRKKFAEKGIPFPEKNALKNVENPAIQGDLPQ